MESDSENKSNSSVKSCKDLTVDVLSENGESHSESENNEKPSTVRKVSKSLKKESQNMEVDPNSSLSSDELPPKRKSSETSNRNKQTHSKQKERKNKNPRPTKPSNQKHTKKSSGEDMPEKKPTFLDVESPVASPKKPEEKQTMSLDEIMDTDSETVIASDPASAAKCDDTTSNIDDKDDGTASDTSIQEFGDDQQGHSEIEMDIAGGDHTELDADELLSKEMPDATEKKTSQNKVDSAEEIEGKHAKADKESKKAKPLSEKAELSKEGIPTSDGSHEKLGISDADENTEKSSQKEKSFGIDAIAKKLGQQVKVNNEGNKEVSDDACDDASSTTDKKSKDISCGDKKTEEAIKEEIVIETPKGKNSEKKESKSEKKKKKVRSCEECGTTKGLKFQVLYQGKLRYLCTDECFGEFKIKQQITKPPTISIKSVEPDICAQCKKALKEGKGYYPIVGETKPLCSEDCLINYQEYNIPKKKCAHCKEEIEDDINCLTWETMEFCNEDCLGKYQSFLGSHCTCCQSPVQQTSLGKYCVCFGADIRQFCSGGCLEEFKKGLKVCSFCQKDLSSGTEGFLAPVGDKGQFKDFCTQQCMERYETMNSKNESPPQTQKCSFCTKSGIFKIEAKHGDKTAVLCSDNCVAGYRYANKIMLKICDTCYKFFEHDKDDEFQLQFEGVNKYYCTKACMTLFVLSHRKIVPCSWCKVKKYNFDMIEKMDSSHQMQTYCSLNCISLFRVSLSATSAKSIRCDNCSKTLPAQYHLTMSDGSIRNFCHHECVVQFQNQFTNVPPLTPVTQTNRQSSATQAPSNKTTAASHTPIISSVMSLATSNQRSPNVGVATKLIPQKLIASANRPVPPALTIITTRAAAPTQTVTTTTNLSAVNPSPSAQVIREVIVRPPPPKSVKNKAVHCRPNTLNKAISCRPQPCHKAVQTDEGPVPTIVPIPVPVYVPTPVHMFSRPVPCPVPFPVPIPVPIFVPLTKDAPAHVIRQLRDIQDKIPSNPFEAELLMMAEMVAENGDKKGKGASSEIADDSVKMEDASQASDLDPAAQDSPLDVEAALPPGIAPVLQKEPEAPPEPDEDFNTHDARSHGKRSAGRGRGRAKRARVEVLSADDSDSFPAMPLLDEQNSTHQAETTDTNLRLKYTFGVNAWKHWVLQKNSQLEQGSQSSRKFKLFKTDLLQLPPDELNYSLCLFVKEVRKPGGDEYAPASIYYLCLGIQQYLFENGRIDNIFTDTYYEKFTECLNDVLLSEIEMMANEGFFISRIEEEVLWESKQLGAHSPHVLLNSLMFFNTKFFNLKSIDDHAHLSFSHITKHWRKTSIKSGPRNVILRYYPPLNKDWQRRRKEENTMYEQNENMENPLRCPVKLYEFYLSKCPESVKTRNDVFYLYPERSCVPDSPVWYSTQALGRDTIAKMLQRIKTVRDIYEL